jgi:thymidylate synthase/tetrahydromethanopterin S-methyltransferase subunit A
MKKVSIGKDVDGKDIFKLKGFNVTKINVFNSSDVIIGNPMSNVAIAFVYTWKLDQPPKQIKDFFLKISNYSYITGLWRTTNGAKYVFSNLLANPNVNKLVVCIFEGEDNGHMLVDALRCFWKNGISNDGSIINSKASNPFFQGMSKDALERLKKQIDLVVIPNATIKKVEETVNACIQEPINKVSIQGVEVIPSSANELYDDGARFDSPYIIKNKNVSSNEFEGLPESQVISTIGLSITADNLDDALKKIVKQVLDKGSILKDQRNITIREERSLSVVIKKPLEKIPEGYSIKYLEKYKDEFMDGVSDVNEFVYTYHDRIFKRWGNQPEKIINLLKLYPDTRRAMISLWDPSVDLGSQTPPCLSFLWFCMRSNMLECHVVYRSHHITTVDKKSKIISGEGAFVPNIYAIHHLHKMIAEKTKLKIGPLILTDFSGHSYVCD